MVTYHCRQKLAELLRRVRRKTRRRPDPPRGLTEAHLLAAEKLSARIHQVETQWRVTVQDGSYSAGALSALADAVDRQGPIPREWRRQPDCCPEGRRLHGTPERAARRQALEAERRQREAERAERQRANLELERKLPGLRFDRRTGVWRARGWGGAVVLALLVHLAGCGAPGQPLPVDEISPRRCEVVHLEERARAERQRGWW